METFYQIAGVAVVTAVLCTVQRHSDQAGVTALVLLFGVLALIAAARLVEPVAQFLQELCSLSAVSPEYLEPVVKTCAIGIVTQIAATVCADAGTPTLAHITQLCGSAAGLYLLLPLLRAVLELVRELMGG